MATPKTKRTPRRGKKKKPAGGKKKLFFLFLFFLILIGLGYLFFTGKLFSPKAESVIESVVTSGKIEIESLMKTEVISGLRGTPKASTKGPAVSQRKTGKRYYIKVGECMYTECRKELVAMVKKLKLPAYRRKSTRKTTYYELISANTFDKTRADQKVLLLKELNKLRGTPYAKEAGHQYRISFGIYPIKEVAVQMQAYLLQFYSRVTVRFEIVPRQNKYSLTTVYAGPFYGKRSGNAAVKKIQERTELRGVTLSTKL